MYACVHIAIQVCKEYVCVYVPRLGLDRCSCSGSGCGVYTRTSTSLVTQLLWMDRKSREGEGGEPTEKEKMLGHIEDEGKTPKRWTRSKE